MSERETPAYVPGDTIVVEIRIGHSMNIDEMYARFCHEDRTYEDRGMFLEKAELEHRNDVEGGGDTLARFTLLVEAKHYPGEYQLRELLVDTWGGKRLTPDEVPDVRFRIEEEPLDGLRVFYAHIR